MPLSLLGFMALLFTTGLDVASSCCRSPNFPLYAREPVYAFANPLAIAFGILGFLVWGFYFLTTFYFLAVEPRLRLFEIPAVKMVNNVVIIGTCAFTAHLLLRNLPFYAPAIGDARPLLRGGRHRAPGGAHQHPHPLHPDPERRVDVAVRSPRRRHVAADPAWACSGWPPTALDLGPYFTQLPRFVLPISDYHAFYLFWWFSWSIMIGQFVARFCRRACAPGSWRRPCSSSRRFRLPPGSRCWTSTSASS